jgi:molecular chaperone GrpE
MNTSGKEEGPAKIPIRFVDGRSVSGEELVASPDSTDPKPPSSEEIGRESSYDDETEVQRRIDRGQERDSPAGRKEADEHDIAGGPEVNETPEAREDRDTSSRRASDDTAGQPPLNAAGAAGPAVAELVATRAELKRVEGENAELRDSLARRQADFENFRKRVERERVETYNRVVGDVVMKLLPVVDNLRRALDAESTVEASESEEFRHFLHGVELISKQLAEVLQGLGLQPIDAIGKPFDPTIHEAVATESSDEHEPDTVLQELAKGYLLGDKLLRPAVVKVATR